MALADGMQSLESRDEYEKSDHRESGDRLYETRARMLPPKSREEHWLIIAHADDMKRVESGYEEDGPIFPIISAILVVMLIRSVHAHRFVKVGVLRNAWYKDEALLLTSGAASTMHE
jgi:hypothetical protein